MAKVDLKMMAAQLGYSVSTISKALRDSHEIGEKTKQIILAKARELGYRPNPYASYMRHQKSKTIALILPEMNNSFFLQVINGAESIAREKDYHLLIYITFQSALDLGTRNRLLKAPFGYMQFLWVRPARLSL